MSTVALRPHPDRGAADGRHGEAAGDVADELVGRVKETLRYARVEGHLSHEDKQGYNGEAVRVKDIVHVLREQVERGAKRNEITEAEKPHYHHGETELDAGEEKEKDYDQSNDTYGYGITHIGLQRS